MRPDAVPLLLAAKQSVANDPDFDLNDYCHCLAPHVLEEELAYA